MRYLALAVATLAIATAAPAANATNSPDCTVVDIGSPESVTVTPISSDEDGRRFSTFESVIAGVPGTLECAEDSAFDGRPVVYSERLAIAIEFTSAGWRLRGRGEAQFDIGTRAAHFDLHLFGRGLCVDDACQVDFESNGSSQRGGLILVGHDAAVTLAEDDSVQWVYERAPIGYMEIITNAMPSY